MHPSRACITAALVHIKPATPAKSSSFSLVGIMSVCEATPNADANLARQWQSELIIISMRNIKFCQDQADGQAVFWQRKVEVFKARRHSNSLLQGQPVLSDFVDKFALTQKVNPILFASAGWSVETVLALFQLKCVRPTRQSAHCAVVHLCWSLVRITTSQLLMAKRSDACADDELLCNHTYNHY